MRITLVSIIIGIILGVMLGATIIAPGLEDARKLALTDGDVLGAEGLIISPPPTSLQKSSAKDARPRILPMISTLPIDSPVYGTIVGQFAKSLARNSGGILYTQRYAPGTLVPKADTFNALKSGAIEAVFSPVDAWDSSSPVLQFFTALPFGPDAQEYLAWYEQAGGREIFETTMQPYQVHPLLCGAVSGAGAGWFRNPIKSVDDLAGLTLKTQGLGAIVLRKLGADPQPLSPNLAPSGSSSSSSSSMTSLASLATLESAFQLGLIDGASYALPTEDAHANLNRFARHAYFPGWQSPLTLFTLSINRNVWDGLSHGEQSILESTCRENVQYSLSFANSLQFESLKKLGLSGVYIRRWPAALLSKFKSTWTNTTRQLAIDDPNFKTAWTSLNKFRRDYAIWHDLRRP